MKYLLLGVLLFAGVANAQTLSLKVSQEDNTMYCGTTEVNIKITKKEVSLRSPKYSLDLKIIKGKLKHSEMIGVDPRGNKYTIEVYQYGEHEVQLILTPEIDYLYKYEVANIDLCD